MKQQLHDTLVNLASTTFKRYMLMPADFAGHYDLARKALSESQEVGDPVGWLIWQQLADHPQKLDCAVRRLAVATSIDGRVLPRTSKRRSLKPRQPLPALA
ncbi:hypothetical protein [Dyella ginsengisoli]|uniref:hypothetical protein n=1 Tax=Dyella ginsengisoli TaxID=363848 RepID=UPI0003675690|nr:hypothetical protein [Dyella ginsengisoli]